MAKRVLNNEYHILSFEAKDIYELSCYDKDGNECENVIEIDTSSSNVSDYYLSTMHDSLDILKIKSIFDNEEIKTDVPAFIIKDNKTLFNSIVNVSFKLDSYKFYKYKKHYKDKIEDNKIEIYVKREFKDIELDISKFENNAYIIDNKLVAIAIGNKVDEERIDPIIKEHIKNKIISINNGTYKIKNKDMSAEELRKKYYESGFDLEIDGHKIHYVRYKRSASKAREGSCLFIDEKYYDEMIGWSYCGLDYKMDETVLSKVVEREAYISLSLSSIEKSITINRNNILVIPDRKSKFSKKCADVCIDENNELQVEKREVEISNTIWDGEGLLDESVFNNNGYENNGMMLLRNRLFKSCCFNTKLQEFFKENNITDVSQITKNPGYITLAEKIEDIKLVITDSSLKYIKFADSDYYRDITIKFWLVNIDSDFGVVKVDHKTNCFEGDLVKTSYQFLNTIGFTQEEAKKLVLPTYNYINEMTKNSTVFKFYLNNETDRPNYQVKYKDIDKDNVNIDDDKSFYSLKNDLCLYLLQINDDFSKTKLYSSFRKKAVEDLKKKVKEGRFYIDGTFATLFGNGYEMLLATIGKYYGKSTLAPGEVYTKKYKDSEKLTAIRFPHVTMGNVYNAINKQLDVYDKWFNLSNEIICVNSIDENIQQALNGCDFDSDAALITNDKTIFDASTRNIGYDFLVPVTNVEPQKVKNNELYKIDHKIANNLVGLIANKSQLVNSIIWDIFNKTGRIDNDLYLANCKLAILCGFEIDKAKRHYPVDASNELRKVDSLIKAKLGVDKIKLPGFMNDKEAKNGDDDYISPMYYISSVECPNVGRGAANCSLFDFVTGKYNKSKNSYIDRLKSNKSKYKAAAAECLNIIRTCNDEIIKYNASYRNKTKEEKEAISYKEDIQAIYDNTFKNVVTNKLIHPAIYLIIIESLADNIEDDKNGLLWILLYIMSKISISGNSLIELFFRTGDNSNLVKDSSGDIELFSKKYKIA